MLRLDGPTFGHWCLLLVALGVTYEALTRSVFIDESDSSSSEIADAKRGVKATVGNRILYVTLSLGLALYAIWWLAHR
jgi:hypothetical protein